MNNNDNLVSSFLISTTVHTIIFLIVFFGVSISSKQIEIEEVSFSVEALPIKNVSNVVDSYKKAQEEKNEEDAKKTDESRSNIEEKKDAAKEASDSKEIDNKKELEELANELTELQKKDKDEKQKSQESAKEEIADKKKPSEDLTSLLKTLEEKSDGDKEQSNKIKKLKKEKSNTTSRGKGLDSLPLSLSEKDAIISQIQRNWQISTFGSKDADKITVTLLVKLYKDGSLFFVEKLSMNCPSSSMSEACNTSVENALRAVKRASPIQNLNPENHKNWGEFEITFIPLKGLMR